MSQKCDILHTVFHVMTKPGCIHDLDFYTNNVVGTRDSAAKRNLQAGPVMSEGATFSVRKRKPPGPALGVRGGVRG